MRYFWAVLAVILVGIVAIVLLVGNNPVTVAPGKTSNLTNYDSSNASLRLTIDGHEVSEEQHNIIQITVDKRTRQLTILNGYQGHITHNQLYDNNAEAFSVFLRALQKADFTKETKDAKPQDERGVCPTGKRYIYELIDGGKTALRTWNTSCGGAGSFTGRGSLVRELFMLQIPDYEKQTNNISL